jgi:uncharacterized membrane-anchored protein
MERSAAREAEAAMAQYRLTRRLEDRKAMRTLLTRAVKFAPDLLAARIGLTELFLEDGDLLQAEEHLNAAEKIEPAHPRLPNLRRRAERARK